MEYDVEVQSLLPSFCCRSHLLNMEIMISVFQVLEVLSVGLGKLIYGTLYEDENKGIQIRTEHMQWAWNSV